MSDAPTRPRTDDAACSEPEERPVIPVNPLMTSIAPPVRRIASRLRQRARSLVGAPGSVPAIGKVRWGGLRCTTPVSKQFGYDRGRPIDRYYIEAFLARWSDDIRGHVLEIKDSNYTRRFGGEKVSASDILDVDSDNQEATIVLDLESADALPAERFDCIVFTQTLQYLFDTHSALAHLHRSLKPGGVLLTSVPAITPLRTRSQSWYWNFTDLSLQRLLAEHFAADRIDLQAYGNLVAATAFLHGLSAQELRKDELDFRDPDYQVTIVARAEKAE